MSIVHVKVCFCVVFLALFISCSMSKFLYNNADFLLLNWFDSYFELREQQRIDLENKIEKFFKWHRKTELPKTILFLDELKSRYEKGVQKEDVSWAIMRFEELWEGILNFAEDDLIAFLLTVDERQVLNLESMLSEKNEKLVESSKMELKELHEHMLDWLYSVFENWLGDLEPSQIKNLAKWVSPDPNWVIIKLNNRKKFNDDIVRLIREKKTLKENIIFWMHHPESHWTEKFKNSLESKKQEWLGIILKFDAITNAGQRKHAATKLQRYSDDFSELAKL